MDEREWSDAVLMVNGQPIRELPEIDFGGDEQMASIIDGVTQLSFPLHASVKAMYLFAKEMFNIKNSLDRLIAICHRGYRFQSHVERRHSRTRRRQRPTRLQRRRQRQMKNKFKR